MARDFALLGRHRLYRIHQCCKQRSLAQVRGLNSSPSYSGLLRHPDPARIYGRA